MVYESLEVERDGPVAVVTLNRPERLNALSVALMREITAVAGELSADEAVRAVIFRGAGRYFTAGADLADAEQGDRTSGSHGARWRRFRVGPTMIRAIHEMNPITICAIHGGALGGGACIATACDFRLGAEGSVAGYPEIDLGMNLSWGALPLCVRLVGPARAKRMVVLGEKVPAETLVQWGFFDELIPESKLRERALELARAYAEKPPFAAQSIKRSINAIASAGDASVIHMDTDQYMLSVDSEEHRAAVAAFLEKRARKT